MQLTRLAHPRFWDAVSAQTADFNEVRSPKKPAILDLMRLNFLSAGITNLVGNEMARYSAGEMAALNANMTVIATFDSRAPARMLEIGLCTGYVATTGKLPPASSKC